MRLPALWVALWAAPVWALAAPAVATVTIVDGDAQIVREAAKFALAEGVRLAQDDLIETGAKSRLLRIEFPDGTAFDLGPESKALLSPRFSGERARVPAKLHLLQGAAKVSVLKGQPAANAAFTTPAFDVAGSARSAVFVVQPQETDAFAEAGELSLQERQGGKAGTAFALKSGDFLARQGIDKPVVTQRPTPSFIQRLPRPFLDTLPLRAEMFKTREVEPKRLGDMAYADVDTWLDADGLRAGFVLRWKALAQQPEFRSGLIANLRSHPEWDRVLYPEKYLPKHPASDAAARYSSKP